MTEPRHAICVAAENLPPSTTETLSVKCSDRTLGQAHWSSLKWELRRGHSVLTQLWGPASSNVLPPGTGLLLYCLFLQPSCRMHSFLKRFSFSSSITSFLFILIPRAPNHGMAMAEHAVGLPDFLLVWACGCLTVISFFFNDWQAAPSPGGETHS